jgi:hypothetical protein
MLTSVNRRNIQLFVDWLLYTDDASRRPFEKVIFVGTCMQRRVPMSIEKTNADLSILEWLDEAEKNGDHVVYVAMPFDYSSSPCSPRFDSVT